MIANDKLVELAIDFSFAEFQREIHSEFEPDKFTSEGLIHALKSIGWSAGQPKNSEEGSRRGGEWDTWEGESQFGGLLRGSRGMNALNETLYWTAGVIARWVRDSDFRCNLRESLRHQLTDAARNACNRNGADSPLIIAAHSLGSLIAYDVLRERFDLGKFASSVSLITFGSQLGNPHVKSVYGGRLCGVPELQYWFHLYNPHDALFTEEVRLLGGDLRRASDKKRNFFQVYTPFDNEDPLDHTAVSTGRGTMGYLDCFPTRQLVWPKLLAASLGRPQSVEEYLRDAVRDAMETPRHRALLIGIDEYERAEIPSLAGATSDTYLMSRILQEQGLSKSNIRVLHNHRATAAAIRDRIEWLLDDVDDGEFRILYFSGHGHQLESYGPQETADRLDECLCPYDYDYSIQSAILDDHLHQLYAQLPLTSQFVVILDCCHSGGMTRAGGRRVRGITAPMDIAHRGLHWNGERWERSSTTETLRNSRDKADWGGFSVESEVPENGNPEAYTGLAGTSRRLFRGMSLRPHPKVDAGNSAPYLPVILQACAENEAAEEHSDGLNSYGAFTFCLAQVLSDEGITESTTWDHILKLTSARIKNLGYRQTPQLLAPSAHKYVLFKRSESQ